MFTRVLETRGKEIKIHEGFLGDNYIFPEGTERVVRKLGVMPKFLGGRGIGHYYALQRAEVKLAVEPSGGGGDFHYNSWMDVREL